MKQRTTPISLLFVIALLTFAAAASAQPRRVADQTMRKGQYIGVMAFDYDYEAQDIGLLSTSTAAQYTQAVNNLQQEASSTSSTSLYYAIDAAIKQLSTQPLPAGLANASMIIFTDGLDNSSYLHDDVRSDYVSRMTYIDSITSRVQNTTINGQKLNSYVIGLNKGLSTGSVSTFNEAITSLSTDGKLRSFSSMTM